MSYIQNKGPCVVCGREKNKENKERFQKLQTQTLAKAQMSPEISLLTIELQVGHELCQKHYNNLVCYDRNTLKGSKKRNSKDTAYHGKDIQAKRICVSQKTSQQLVNDIMTVEQLELQIEKLKKELISLRETQKNGNINRVEIIIFD